MKYILFCFFILCSFTASAESTDNVLKEGQVILETIERLTKDGYLTEKNALDAKQEYVFDNPELLQKVINLKNESNESKVDSEVSFTDYITWVNALFFVGVITLLIAFSDAVKACWHLVTAIPAILYQLLFLSISLSMSFKPELYSLSHSFYFVLFGSIANIIVIGWLIHSYQDFCIKIAKALSLGLSPETMASFWLAIYFGYFAIMQESSTFGLLSVLFLLSMLSFTIIKLGLGIRVGSKKEKPVEAIIICNMLILTLYSVVQITGFPTPYIEHFSIGIEYSCSFILGVALLITSSPFCKDDNIFSFSLFSMLLVSVLGFSVGVFFNLAVIAAFTNTFFVLFACMWLLYTFKDTNRAIILTVFSIMLFGLGKVLIEFPEYFITTLA